MKVKCAKVALFHADLRELNMVVDWKKSETKENVASNPQTPSQPQKKKQLKKQN